MFFFIDEDKTEEGLPSTHILKHFHKEFTEDGDEVSYAFRILGP